MEKLNRLTLFVVFVLFVAPLAGAQIYTVTDLGSLGGNDIYTIPTGINDLGRVVGVASATGDADRHAFLWTKISGMQDLGTLGGANVGNGTVSIAYGINDFDQVAGASVTTGNASEHAFLWTKTSGLQDLGTLGGGNSFGYAINDREQVAGLSITPTGDTHAFRWTRADGMQDLGTLGGLVSVAFGINDLGHVVGFSYTTSYFNPHAFLWTEAEGMKDLGTLGGATSVATGINAFGQVVGYSLIDGGVTHAFLWTKIGGMHDLGAPGASSFATGINAFGQVVGYSLPGPAFLWTEEAGIQDLNSLIPADSGWFLQYAFAINLWGQIVGEGTINGQSHAFLLTPKSLRPTH
jgi:probable HAF family extracellular repeat protein